MADKYIFRNVEIIDPNAKVGRKKTDIYVVDGIITAIGCKLKESGKEYDFKGCAVMPGFCDLYVDFCDPGYEQREDIHSGSVAAAAGGFTAVCMVPHTQPVVQSKSSVEYIINKSAREIVDVYPLGAVSEHLEGKQPTEMYDMQRAGAIGFTDAPKSLKNSGLLLRALQYVQPFKGLVLDMSTDDNLSNDGQVSEGEVSVRMGLKGIPHMAEVVQLKRNIEILRYTGGKLHMYGISTKEGVALIRAAKEEGLAITASVFTHHLLFTDADMHSYDANLKTLPPFRLEADRAALKNGLLDGTIDCISSQHTPLEIEEKKLEFEYAAAGLTGLETAYAEVKQAFHANLSDERIVEWLSVNPRQILGLPEISIQKGKAANFAIIHEEKEWEYNDKSRKSRSGNSPFIGKKLKGKVIATFNKGKLMIHD